MFVTDMERMPRRLQTRPRQRWVRLADVPRQTRLAAVRRIVKQEPHLDPLSRLELALIAEDPGERGGWVAD